MASYTLFLLFTQNSFIYQDNYIHIDIIPVQCILHNYLHIDKQSNFGSSMSVNNSKTEIIEQEWKFCAANIQNL
jgi:hypothetical protein